ncbi:hypothetical protein F4779DRAFT_624563 [Xylariaceae sp. FL0662B]|nr:hypothetical protein F4779DRAFT_624563 [Xylariaceae sp. FL0662B]
MARIGTDVTKAKRSRRPHHKSRNGCSMCKLRKVKCNEDKPVCGNCIRFGFDCESNACPTNPTSLAEPSRRTGGVGRSSRGRGRPRKNWAGASSAITLIHGVRFLLETLDPAVLSSGLMQPLSNSRPSADATRNFKPSSLREDCPGREWQEPLGALRSLVTSSQTSDTLCCIHALDELVGIYEAVFGIESGTYNGPPENQHVFGWLYRMKPSFIACLKRKERLALLILAYYAVLFQTMDELWYLDGWMEHLILNVNALITTDFSRWMEWPMSQVAEFRTTRNDRSDLRDECEQSATNS